MSDKKIKELLKKGDKTPDYPADQKTARKAEFTTMGRVTRKNLAPGCPLLGGSILGLIGLVVLLIQRCL